MYSKLEFAFLPRDAMHSVGYAVTRWHCVQTAEHVKLLSPF